MDLDPIRLLGIDLRRGARPLAADLTDHWFVPGGAVPVSRLCRMEHEASRLQRDGTGDVERVARAGIPGALQYGDVAIVRVPMRRVHEVRRELDPNHIGAAGFAWVPGAGCHTNPRARARGGGAR